MNNILLTGNGFDLAHGLLTNYKDFLIIMKMWNSFYGVYKDIRNGVDLSNVGNEYIEKYLLNVNNMDNENIEKLNSIINQNSWVKYFCQCEAEIDLWIDFEREMIPVMNLFDVIFESSCKMTYINMTTVEASIDEIHFSEEMKRTASLWEKYFDELSDGSIIVNSPFVSRNYGVLKKKILKDLRDEFDKFIEAFEIYLCEFVDKVRNIEAIEQIKKLNITHVISFNYTSTEKLYGVSEENVHHIHGQIRKDLNIGKNNMVVGVNENMHQNMDFIYFVKYFQRIQKGIGVKYKRFIEMARKNAMGAGEKEPYNLFIYGHSLDETDEDILRYLIGDGNDRRTFFMKPKKVVVFYYDDEDYAQKVINLIKLYGRPIVEAYMENKLFEFVKTES